MKKLTILGVVAGLICSAGMPSAARAEDGAVAAGVAGGLLGGLLLGGALAPRPYYAPEPVYVEPPPPPYRCYWRLGRPYWDDWRGVWVRPRIRVCD
jgi:hypothetical protein